MNGNCSKWTLDVGDDVANMKKDEERGIMSIQFTKRNLARGSFYTLFGMLASTSWASLTFNDTCCVSIHTSNVILVCVFREQLGRLTTTCLIFPRGCGANRSNTDETDKDRRSKRSTKRTEWLETERAAGEPRKKIKEGGGQYERGTFRTTAMIHTDTDAHWGNRVKWRNETRSARLLRASQVAHVLARG